MCRDRLNAMAKAELKPGKRSPSFYLAGHNRTDENRDSGDAIAAAIGKASDDLAGR
jgi:hypothetical protein